VSVPASAFSNNVYRQDERHWMHALSLEGSGGALQWRAIGSDYRYGRDVLRTPSVALPAAAQGGAGSILRLDGTGWRTLDLDASWQAGAHTLSFGGHYDGFRLVSDRFATTDWRRGAADERLQGARGRTGTFALWVQDRWTLTPALELTLGARQEWWRAFDGANFSRTPAVAVDQPELSRAALSPKAALSWRPAAGWRVTLSAGEAYRFPTVTELYQAVASGPSIVIPDPHLRPERARSEELALERSFGDSHIRLSLFNERIRDALISQTSPALVSFVQNVAGVRTHGAELVLDWRDILPRLDLSGSVTLAAPRIVSDPGLPGAEGKDIPQVPRRRATLLATYRAGTRASFTLGARYSSRAFGTVDNSDVVSHTFQGFDPYFVVDARATFRLTGQLEMAVGVENLTDDRYFVFHPFPGRTASAELSYRW
jgi:iron complex outermembrane receptor protein